MNLPELPTLAREIQLERDSSGAYGWRFLQAELPVVSDTQVLVKVRGASIQRGDVEVSEMLNSVFGVTEDLTGQIGGSDAAGEVVRVGAGVRSVAVGDKVVSQFFSNYVDSPLRDDVLAYSHGWTLDGVFGDYVVLEETGVSPMPRHLSFEEASTLPSSALTAWAATGVGQSIKPGDTVLVQGTGGVSAFAIQFAVAQGARVIVTSSSHEKLEKMSRLGAQAGINYRENQDWASRVLELTDGRGADLVLDMGGRSTMEGSLKSLAREGTLALVGGLGGYDATLPTYELISKGATARGVIAASRAEFVRMVAFMEQHDIHPVIDRVYDFADFQQAMRQLESGEFIGKLVLRL